MKKLSKLQINSDKIIKNEDLVTLKGGYGSIKCYSEGWGSGCMGSFVYINTACAYALTVCESLGGHCVEC